MKDEYITLAHGSGGRLTGELIRRVFTSRFAMTEPLTDSALLENPGYRLAFTSDSYVVEPLFFPGGNIGKLAVCGTVNDLSVSGAIPVCLSASFIIEEGFQVGLLDEIAQSMAEEAMLAGVKIVTGDTKVVGRGKCDRVFITTSGIGYLRHGFESLSGARNVRAGNVLIINGSLGNHSIAVMGARKNLNFETPVESDVASLNHMIGNVLEKCRGITFMRDITRGGFATVVNELCSITGKGAEVDEDDVPVDEPVRGVCEMLGFDPLYLANEGKVLIVAEKSEAAKILDILKADPLGKNSAMVGRIADDKRKLVILRSITGGRRILDMRSGMQLPRIC